MIYIYKNVFFDLDGTLTDPWEGITKSIKYALEKMGIPTEDEKELISFIGPPLKESFKKGFGFDETQADQAMSFFRERYSVKGLYENELYEGTHEILKMLKEQGRNIYLATSKPVPYATEILRHFKIIQYFDGIYGASMDEKLVVKSDILAKAIEEENVDINESIMVGDRVHDILGAKKVGMDSVYLELGYADDQEAEILTSAATYKAKNMKELSRLFQEI